MSTDRADVLHGTLALMILRTLDSMGPLHGYGIARRIEQISGNELQLKVEADSWTRTSAIVERFVKRSGDLA
jgi:DNA-binding PadR family transcriptional regulator